MICRSAAVVCANAANSPQLSPYPGLFNDFNMTHVHASLLSMFVASTVAVYGRRAMLRRRRVRRVCPVEAGLNSRSRSAPGQVELDSEPVITL